MGLFGGNAASPSFPGQCGASVGPPARRPAQGLGGQHGAWPVGWKPRPTDQEVASSRPRPARAEAGLRAPRGRAWRGPLGPGGRLRDPC